MKKKAVALLTSLTLLLVALTGCGTTSESVSSDSVQASSESESTPTDTSEGLKVVTYGLSSSWGSLNPALTTVIYSLMVSEKLYDKLAYCTPSGYGLRAAESMEASDDLKTITVKLKPNKWHDGEPVTAYDWEWTVKYYTDPALTGISKSNYAVYAGTDDNGDAIAGEELGFKALDDETLEITLKEPSTVEAYAINKGDQLYVLPKHLLEDVAPEDFLSNEFFTHPIGSGPLKFVSVNSDNTELVLEKNDDFYYELSFDRLIYKVMDSASFATSFLAGELDACYSTLSAEEALVLGENENLTTTKVDGLDTVEFLSVNNEKFNARERYAFSIIIDQAALLEIFGGYGELCEHFTSPLSNYYLDITKEQNIEEGVKILQEEGFDFNQTITLAASTTIRESMAASIQADFAEAGINLEILTGDHTSLSTQTKEGSIDMMFFGYPINPLDSNIANILSPTYFSRCTDLSYRQACYDFNGTEDESERKEIMQNLEQRISDECPYICLFRDYSYETTSSRVSNILPGKYDACWTWEVE